MRLTRHLTILRTFLVAITALLICAAPARAAEDRLDLGAEDVVAQFVAYADSQGVAEHEITAAIIDGRFVPDRRDLFAVLIHLGQDACARMFKRVIADDYTSPTTVLTFDCGERFASNPNPLHGLWNARFGPVDEATALLAAQRNYLLLTGNMTDPLWIDATLDEARGNAQAENLMNQIINDYSIAFHTVWTAADGGRLDLRGRYDTARASYLSRLDPSSLSGLGLVADDQVMQHDDRPDLGLLEAAYHGDFFRLAWTARAAGYLAEGGTQRGWQDKAAARFAKTPTLRGHTTLWTLIRMQELGACDDRLTPLVYTRTNIKQWYVDGILEDTSSAVVEERTIDVPADFADILIASPETVSADLPAYRALAQRLGCDSATRKRLEANLRAFFYDTPPPFTSGL